MREEDVVVGRKYIWVNNHPTASKAWKDQELTITSGPTTVFGMNFFWAKRSSDGERGLVAAKFLKEIPVEKPEIKIDGAYIFHHMHGTPDNNEGKVVVVVRKADYWPGDREVYEVINHDGSEGIVFAEELTPLP